MGGGVWVWQCCHYQLFCYHSQRQRLYNSLLLACLLACLLECVLLVCIRGSSTVTHPILYTHLLVVYVAVVIDAAKVYLRSTIVSVALLLLLLL